MAQDAENYDEFNPTHQIGVIATLKEAWQKVKGFKATVFSYFLVFLLLSIGLAIFSALVFFLSNTMSHGNMFHPESMMQTTMTSSSANVEMVSQVKVQQIHSSPANIISQIIIQIISMVFGLFIFSSLIIQSIRNVCNRSGSISHLFSDITHPWRVIGAILLMTFVLGGIFEICAVAIATQINPSLPFLGGLLFLVLLILGLWVILRLLFVLPLILEKHLGIWAAIKTSFTNTKGYVFKMFLTLLLYIIIYVVTTLLLLLLVLPLGLLSGSMPIAFVGAGILTFLALLWLYPFGLNITAIFYRNLCGAKLSKH